MNRRAVLDSATADRLAKLCGLFSSHHDGERAVAAAMADRLIRACGLTWREIIVSRPSKPKQPKISSAWVEPRTIDEAIQAARVHRHLLSEWEALFSMNLRTSRLSAKQRMILEQIINKIRCYYAREAAPA